MRKDMSWPMGSGWRHKYTALSSALTGETGEVGRVKGYASRFGEPDQAGDIGHAGRVLASLEAAGRGRPVGQVPLAARCDQADRRLAQGEREPRPGCGSSGEVLTELQLGAEAALLMRAGAIDGLSIGYRVVRSEPEPRDRRAAADRDRPLGGFAGHLPNAAERARPRSRDRDDYRAAWPRRIGGLSRAALEAPNPGAD